MKVEKNCVAEGVEQIQCLKGLGQSFASKQLRFLVPKRAVILDDRIREKLGYEKTVCGYTEFLTDCHKLLKYAEKSQDLHAKLRRELGTDLYVCNIEAALYAKIQIIRGKW